MTSPRRAPLVLAALLAASLLLNGVLWFRRSTPATEPSTPAAVHPAEAVVTGSGLEQSPPPSVAGCEQRLRECQSEQAARGEPAWYESLRMSGADAGAATIDARAATPQLQQELLSQIAREHLRREWDRKRDEVVRGVLRDLRNPDKLRRDFERDVGQYAQTLGLADPARLKASYEPIHQRRITAVERALGKEPPDFATVLAELRGLYADEDLLAAGLASPEAVARFRLSQLERRTVVLGIAATYAQQPWEQSLWWDPRP